MMPEGRDLRRAGSASKVKAESAIDSAAVARLPTVR